MGVGSIGIAVSSSKPSGSSAMRRECARTTPKAPPPGPHLRVKVLFPYRWAILVGERRYLTVMFCDLVGSTGISAQLDAEEWRDLVGSYLDAASAAVTGAGGQVAKKLGDGLLALFGYPITQENDASAPCERRSRSNARSPSLIARTPAPGKPELVARIGLDNVLQRWLTRPARFTATLQMPQRV